MKGSLWGFKSDGRIKPDSCRLTSRFHRRPPSVASAHLPPSPLWVITVLLSAHLSPSSLQHYYSLCCFSVLSSPPCFQLCPSLQASLIAVAGVVCSPLLVSAADGRKRTVSSCRRPAWLCTVLPPNTTHKVLQLSERDYRDNATQKTSQKPRKQPETVKQTGRNVPRRGAVHITVPKQWTAGEGRTDRRDGGRNKGTKRKWRPARLRSLRVDKTTWHLSAPPPRTGNYLC